MLQIVKLALISAENGQARIVENKDPLDLRRLSIFQKAAPLIAKRIEVNRAHFLLGYGELMFMMLEKRVSASLGRNPLAPPAFRALFHRKPTSHIGPNHTLHYR